MADHDATMDPEAPRPEMIAAPDPDPDAGLRRPATDARAASEDNWRRATTGGPLTLPPSGRAAYMQTAILYELRHQSDLLQRLLEERRA